METTTVVARSPRALIAALGALVVLIFARPAAAQSTIEKYGARPSYGFELEPHPAANIDSARTVARAIPVGAFEAENRAPMPA